MQILTSQPTALVKARTHLKPAPQPELEAAGVADSAAIDQSRDAVVDPAQAVRISRFVSDTKESGARNLRAIMGMMAGQLTGMTIGSMIFAPLAFKFGNLYIATGGAAITGGALALLGHTLASRELGKGSAGTFGNAAATLGAAAKSLPSFVYPTVAGATAAEKSIIYSALDRLPLSGVTSAPTIDVVTGLEKAGASGLATPLFSHSRIFLDRDQMALGREWAQEVTTHEIGHTFDFSKGVGPIGNRSHRGGGFGSAPFVSDYAGTNRMEDYAEGYAHYHRHPEELLKKAPGKFERLAQQQQPGLVDQALDRPSVRDAGRRVGTAFERAPYLRNLLALGSSLVSPFQIYRGAANIERGLQSGDQKALSNGKLQLATGSALLLSGTAPLGLALGVGTLITSQLVEEGTITPKQANDFADKTLAVATGPLGFIAQSIESELDKGGLTNAKGGGAVAAFHSNPISVQRPGLALAGGFALGAAAGGILGPLIASGTGSAASLVSSAAGGTWLGGLAGAALGIGGQMLLSARAKSPVATFLADQQGLTRGDKALLAKLTAPTVVAGAGGAVLGGYAGDYVGAALGQAVAGAAGGVTGAALGRYLGILGGSLAGAKGGAKLGASWAGLARPANASA